MRIAMMLMMMMMMKMMMTMMMMVMIMVKKPIMSVVPALLVVTARSALYSVITTSRIIMSSWCFMVKDFQTAAGIWSLRTADGLQHGALVLG